MAIVFQAGSRLLTSKEAAAILCIHENTLRRWSDLGIIPAFRVGPRGDRRYFETDVRSYLESGSCARKPNQRSKPD